MSQSDSASPGSPPEELSPEVLLARWDAQQTAYIRYRDQRFDAMTQVITLLGKPEPRILDLACGPGSLTQAIRKRFADAQLTAVDKDPLLLAIANEIFADDPKVTVAATDLEQPDWADSLDGPFDVIVSSTALHWLSPESLARLYFDLANLITPGGAFMNADHLQYNSLTEPTLHQIASDDDNQSQQAAFDNGTDTWENWWPLAEAQPRYAEATAERKKCWEGKTGPRAKLFLDFHLAALRSAGFKEVNTIWQYLDDHVVAAIR